MASVSLMFGRSAVASLAISLLICATDAGSQTVRKPLAPLVPSLQPALRPIPILGNFSDIHVTVNGFSARIDWAPYVGSEPAAKYGIFRGTTLLAEVPASVTSYTDATLRDSTSYIYQVQAVGAPRVINVIPGAAPPGANQQGGTIPNPVLAKSNSVSITTLPLLPPRSVTAAVNPTNPISFNVSWAPAPNAQTYNVVRNGQLLGRFTGAFTDTPPRTGWYTYAVATVASEPGGDGVSALSVPVTIHNGPFTVVAFGDSIVWGQGIADAHKFTTLVKNSVSASLAYEAKLSSFARSGAHLVPRPIDPTAAAQQLEIASASGLMTSLVNMQPLGEVPNAYPTIYYQSMFMAPQVVDPANVDLIIMDGCINDISVETVLDPTSQDPDLLSAANQHCGGEMTAILQAVHAKYSRAKIVVIGYYAMISNLSDLTFLNALANAVGVPAGSIAGATGGTLAPLVGIPIDPATGTVIGAIAGAITGTAAPGQYRVIAVDHSNLFATQSTVQLANAVATLNAAAGPNVARFARPPFQDVNAYASPQTWLWIIPSDAYPPKDEMFDKRLGICSSLQKSMTAVDFVSCVEASMGHPNLLGAQQYATAIETQIAPFLSEWRRTLAGTQTATP
jgi:hypothetical protein